MHESMVLPQPVFDVQRAAERASFDFGWLRTSHSFSFADYYDPRNVNWGALRVFNDDRVEGGKGFGTHPHRDMEIVTYVLSGQLGVKPQYGQMEFPPEQRENTWLLVASGQPGLSAPVALTQDASFRVSRLSDSTLRHTFAPGRLGFFFVASGSVAAAAFDGNDAAVGTPATLGDGDAVRIAGVTRLDISGSGEVVLWDVSRPPDGAND